MPQLDTTISPGLWRALMNYAQRSQEPVAHIVRRALAEYLQVSHHTLYQVSTATALVEGIYLSPRLSLIASSIHERWYHCYHGMEYSDDKKQMEQWIPLVMEGRDPATRMVTGTDVDYGALTKDLLDSLRGEEGFSIHFFNRVQDLRRDGDLWSVRVRDEKSGAHRDVQACCINGSKYDHSRTRRDNGDHPIFKSEATDCNGAKERLVQVL